jgi:hypothetical protein
MHEVVIDTNVLRVGSGHHTDVSPTCVLQCIDRLQQVQQKGCVVIDDGYRIIREYLHELDPKRGKGVGDVFVKWLLQNQANAQRVQRVPLTERGENDYAEFPDAALAAQFDPPDRKFVAVAHAHPRKPPILQATDSKWLRWHAALAQHGVRVDFLCSSDVVRFFKAKFPNEPVPSL